MVPAGVGWAGSDPELWAHGKGAAPHCSGGSCVGSSVGRKNVRARCDNQLVVSTINSGSCREAEAMHLRRCLAFMEAQRGFHMVADHIRGVDNVVADALSRNKLPLAQSLMQGAEPRPVPVSDGVLEVVARTKPDWTDGEWEKLWTISLAKDWQSQQRGLTQ